MGDDLQEFEEKMLKIRPLAIELALDAYAAAGVAGITVWRDALSGRDPVAMGELIRGAGLTAVSLCRGGFFVSPEAGVRAAAVADTGSE